MPKISGVYKQNNNLYRASVSLGSDNLGRRIQRTKRGFKTQKDAQNWRLKMLADFGKNSTSANSSMSFKIFLDDYFIPYYKGYVGERTFDMALPKLKKLDYFGNMKLNAITAPCIQKWQNSLFTVGLSSNYIRSIHQIFQQILDQAVKLGMLPNNPAKIVGNVKKEKPKTDFWTPEEFQKFISTFDTSDTYEHLKFVTFWFFYMTGVRSSELLALNWSDIDFEKKTVSINKSLYYKSQRNWKYKPTKSRASNRLLALDDDTLKVLSDWKSIQSKTGKIDFVFSLNGLPQTKGTWGRNIKKHSEYAGVKRIRVHDLRHSQASLMLSLGMSLLQVQDRLGHDDEKTTLGTYSHLYPNAMREVANQLTGQIKISDNNVMPKKFQGNQHVKKL